MVRAIIRPRTYGSYELHVRHYVILELATIRLSALRPERIRGLLKHKLDMKGFRRKRSHTRALYSTPHFGKPWMTGCSLAIQSAA
jgi:hypothetical protein